MSLHGSWMGWQSWRLSYTFTRQCHQYAMPCLLEIASLLRFFHKQKRKKAEVAYETSVFKKNQTKHGMLIQWLGCSAGYAYPWHKGSYERSCVGLRSWPSSQNYTATGFLGRGRFCLILQKKRKRNVRIDTHIKTHTKTSIHYKLVLLNVYQHKTEQ